MVLFEDEHGLCCRPAQLIASITPTFPSRYRIVTAEGVVGYCYQVKILADSGLCQISKTDWLNPSHMRRFQFTENVLLITMENGEKVRVKPKWVPAVRAFLRIDDYKPQPEALTRLFLREYPFEIARASAELLKAKFSSPHLLIANMIWQALEFSRLGMDKNYGYTHHGFFYNPLHATLDRAGFITDSFTKDDAEELYQRILARMVAEDRLFNFRDLGFRDKFAHQREIGSRHPHIVLVIEKESLSDAGIAAARHCGVSWIVTGGVARLVTVEFFCAALQEIYQGPVTAVDYGDFDPGGWLNGRTFVKHLQRYDTHCPDGPHFLIRPELYTQEELDLLSRPLSGKDGRVDEWMAESGGIAGQPRGIHADWLQPPERVTQALEALLKDLPKYTRRPFFLN